MLRSAAKNNAAVTVVSSPSQYPELLAELASLNGATSRALRRKFAAATYALTASYDSAISRWFAGELGAEASTVTRTYVKDLTLKYGCNPHQKPSWVGHLGETPAMPFEVRGAHESIEGARARCGCIGPHTCAAATAHARLAAVAPGAVGPESG